MRSKMMLRNEHEIYGQLCAAGVQALLAHAGEACTPTIGNLPKLFHVHSLT